jgi:hypothetical protein
MVMPQGHEKISKNERAISPPAARKKRKVLILGQGGSGKARGQQAIATHGWRMGS